MTKEELLEHAYVISIDDNRLDRFYENMKKINFYNIKHVIGHLNFSCLAKNINYTTITLVRHAKINKYPHITIFEDDACPVKDFDTKFKIALDNFPDNPNVVSFGYSHCKEFRNKGKYFDNFKNDFFKNMIYINKKYIRSFWGAHSYIIYEQDYDRYIHFLSKFDPKKSSFDTDRCMHLNNGNFYTLRIPIFVQKNYNENNVHKDEGAKTLNKLFKDYGIECL